jgi:hypothetical protein
VTRTRTIEAFAKANGVKPGAVLRQLRGRLPQLQRRRRTPDLAMMASVATTCEECEGSGSKPRSSGGKDISEVLAMPVTEHASGQFLTERGVNRPFSCVLQYIDHRAKQSV